MGPLPGRGVIAEVDFPDHGRGQRRSVSWRSAPVPKESHDPNRDRDPGQLLWRRTPATCGGRDDAGDKPGHRRGVRLGATLGRGRRGCRLPGRSGRIPGLARCHAVGAEPRPSPNCRRAGGQCRGADQDRGREHRQAVRPDPVRGDPSGGRPGSLLRRRGPASRRPVGGGVHERSHLHDPPRALGRVRPGGAVELPADDGRLEVRPCDGRRETRSSSNHRTPPRRRR